MGRQAAIWLVLLFLWGCAAGGGDGRYLNVSRSELLAQLQLGHSVLRCREGCLPVWRDAQPRAAQLDASDQWGDLAVLVMRTDYQDDLSLYYLGKAAEGMGFYPAAAAYYRQSMELSGTSISCANLSRLCGGLTLPVGAAHRLSVVQQQLNRPMPRRRQTIIRPPTSTPTANQAPEPAAPEREQEPSKTAADDGDKGIAASPAASTAPPNPSSAYVEPLPNTGYLEPPPIAR
jgi:hypothetical protein